MGVRAAAAREARARRGVRLGVTLLAACAGCAALIDAGDALDFGAGSGGGDAARETAGPFAVRVAPARVQVHEGGSASLTVSVDRAAGFTAPIKIGISGFTGVTAAALTLVAPANDAELALSVAPSAPIGAQSGTVVATRDGADDYAVAPLAIDVVPPAGTADTTFGDSGQVTLSFGGGARAKALALTADGEIVVVGVYAPDASGYPAAFRFHPDGKLDTGFGASGIANLGLTIPTAVAVLSDGRIVVGGDSVTVPDGGASFAAALQVLTSAGVPDTTVGPSGVVTRPTGMVLDLGVTPTSLTAFATSGNNFGFALLRYSTPSFIPDTGFGSGGLVTTPSADTATRLVVNPDGSILAMGRGTPLVARYTRAGAPDLAFGSGGSVTSTRSARAGALATDADGGIVLGVTAIADGATTLQRLNADGSPDLNFGNGGVTAARADGEVTSLLVAPDASILMSMIVTDGSGTMVGIERFSARGDFDSSFGTLGTLKSVKAFSDAGRNIALTADGKLVVVGSTANAILLARYFL